MGCLSRQRCFALLTKHIQWVKCIAGLIVASITLSINPKLSGESSSEVEESSDGEELIGRTLFVTTLMAIYWMTEALPITITALVSDQLSAVLLKGSN